MLLSSVTVLVPKFFTQFSTLGAGLPVLSQVYKALGDCACAAEPATTPTSAANDAKTNLISPPSYISGEKSMAACHEPIRWRRTDPVESIAANRTARAVDLIPDKSYWTSMLASAERRLIAAA
jgi:hypothetical protein